MSKYIIELKELPKNCFECPAVSYDGDLMGENWCWFTKNDANGDYRPKDCPIKIFE